MTKPGKTKKEKAFKLFDEGATASSPSIKALSLTANTRYSYYCDWKKAGGISPPSVGGADQPMPKGGRGISELDMVVIPEPGESKGDQDADEPLGSEGDGDTLDLDAEDEGEPNPEPKPEPNPEPKESKGKEPGSDGKKTFPTVVAGQGLTFSITISTKTLALYQYAASLSKGPVIIGDFIDICVEDYYKGRGLDLGLVRIGGNDKHG